MDPCSDARRSATAKSTLPRPSESQAPSAITTPASSITTDDDPATPSVRYWGIEKLFSAIRNASGDGLRVEGVTPAIFSRILAARSETNKCRLSFSGALALVIVTIPSGPHERASARFARHIGENIGAMGLWGEMEEEWAKTFTPAAGHPFAGSGEGDDAFTPILPNGVKRTWPSVVLEVGFSQSMADLRTKGRLWFEHSNYAVQVVILVKFRQSQGSITLEKWKAVLEDHRTGATQTRGSERNTRRPRCVQEMTISRPGVGNTDAARLDPSSYIVVRGPLTLEFAELFLRDPGQGESDIVFVDEVLKDMAVRAWREE